MSKLTGGRSIGQGPTFSPTGGAKLPPLILASSSPRRASILRQLGFRFRRAHPLVDERPRAGESPRAYVRRLAREKARKIASRHPRAWVAAADTVVVAGGAILGKPANQKEVRRMLKKLSARWHQVLTGLALCCRSREKELVDVSTTRVLFRRLSEREIRWYAGSGEPADKAGAYAIQGKGGLFIKRVQGSPSNVVGFPVETFYRLLIRAGIKLP